MTGHDTAQRETLVRMAHALVTYWDQRKYNAPLDSVALAVLKCARLIGEGPGRDRALQAAAIADVVMLTTEPEPNPAM